MEDTTVYTVAEKMPEFSGGNKKLFELFSKTDLFECGLLSSDEIICTRITAEFIITANGEVKDVNVFFCKAYNSCITNSYAKRLSEGKWIPGEIDGKKVNVRIKIPIIVETR